MIGNDPFGAVFGISAPGDNSPETTIRVAKAAAKAGIAVLIIDATSKLPICPLAARAAKLADQEAQERGLRRHDCGVGHASRDAAELQKWLTRLTKAGQRYNLAVVPGLSRLIGIDVDTEAEVAAWVADRLREERISDDEAYTVESLTVHSPGVRQVGAGGEETWIHKNGGHVWFSLPKGHPGFEEAPVGKVTGEGGWVAYYGPRAYILVPPSARPEGPYSLVGQVEEAPAWLLQRIDGTVQTTVERRERQASRVRIDDDPIDVWAAMTSWASLLEPDGWIDTGKPDSCSPDCLIWTRPGDSSHYKSATAHAEGCGRYDLLGGHGPLHLWTDWRPDWLPEGAKTLSKLQYVAHRDHAGKMGDAMRALKLGRAGATTYAEIPPAEWPEGATEERPAQAVPVIPKPDGGWPIDPETGLPPGKMSIEGENDWPHLVCPSCPYAIEVSEEDADASLSEMLRHLSVRHADHNEAKAYELLAKVREEIRPLAQAPVSKAELIRATDADRADYREHMDPAGATAPLFDVPTEDLPVEPAGPPAEDRKISAPSSPPAKPPAGDRPIMGEEGWHGIAADIVRTLEPSTEADPHAVLFVLLAMLGNYAGNKAHIWAGATEHPARLWPLLVGKTALGKKGTATNVAAWFMRQVDEEYMRDNVTSGLSTAEGLIAEVADPPKEKGEEGAEDGFDPGLAPADKRRIFREDEFATLLGRSRRENNVISAAVREAYDGVPMRVKTRQDPLVATNHHVTIVGAITPDELMGKLTDGDIANGFANRFLVIYSRRSKSLPRDVPFDRAAVSALLTRLDRALRAVAPVREMGWTERGAKLWDEYYRAMDSRDLPGGRTADLVNRWNANTLRLAVTYALLDGEAELDEPHVRAGIAAWRYVEDSISAVFDDEESDKELQRLMEFIDNAPEPTHWRTRNEIYERCFNKILGRAEIDRVVERLLATERYEAVKVQPIDEATGKPKGGRPTWVYRRATKRKAEK